jgi:hypothetical protein
MEVFGMCHLFCLEASPWVKNGWPIFVASEFQGGSGSQAEDHPEEGECVGNH